MNPRPRKRKNQRLPEYVYCARGRYFFKPYLGRKDGKSRFGKEIWLAPESASLDQVWEAYRAMKSDAAPGTLEWLADQYFASHYFARLAPRTQRDYGRYWNKLRALKTRRGEFGKASLSAITPGVIRALLDKRIVEAGPSQSNHERSLLSAIFGYGYERDVVPKNPVRGVKPQKTPPRRRYVSDPEYDFVYELASERIQICMELAYLCRLRKVEIIGPRFEDMKASATRGVLRADVLLEGLKVRRTKGSKTQIIAWTPRLRATVDRALALPGQISSLYLLHDKYGEKIREGAFNSAWRRLMRHALASGLAERFTFHDLKAKGVSDTTGDKVKASGHRSAAMTAIYDRKVEIVEPTR